MSTDLHTFCAWCDHRGNHVDIRRGNAPTTPPGACRDCDFCWSEHRDMRPLTTDPMVAVVGGPCAGSWVAWTGPIDIDTEIALDDERVLARSAGPAPWFDPATAGSAGRVVYRVTEVPADIFGADRVYLVPR